MRLSERGSSKRSRAKHGFPKESRVRKRREYQDIQARGRRVSSAHFVLILAFREPSPRVPQPPSPGLSGTLEGRGIERAAPTPGGSPALARLGITASRKVGGAVVRNRMKRLVRHAFVQVRDWFPSELDIVVVVRCAWPEAKVNDVIAEWESLERNLRRQIQEARKLADRAFGSPS